MWGFWGGGGKGHNFCSYGAGHFFSFLVYVLGWERWAASAGEYKRSKYEGGKAPVIL